MNTNPLDCDWLSSEDKNEIKRLDKARFGFIMLKALQERDGLWVVDLSPQDMQKLQTVKNVLEAHMLDPSGVNVSAATGTRYKLKTIKITQVEEDRFEADVTSLAGLYLDENEELFRQKPHIYFCRKQGKDAGQEREVKCFWISGGTPNPEDLEDLISHKDLECETEEAQIRVQSCTYGQILKSSGKPGRASERLQIPLYQRRYSWGTGQDVSYVFEQENMGLSLEDNESTYEPGKCENLLLLQDVSKIALEYVNYQDLNRWYMGAVVVQKRDIENRSVVDVVDGQQRFTSLQLLLLAVVKKAIELHEWELARGVMYSCLLTGDRADEDALEPRLIPTRSDRKTYFALLTQVHEELKGVGRGTDHFFPNIPMSNRFVKTERFGVEDSDADKVQTAFDYFYENLGAFLQDPPSSALLHGMVKAVTNGLEFSVISLTEAQSPTQIFDAMNSRGLDLTVADLFKNRILNKFPKPESPEAIEFHDSYMLPWEGHFKYSVGGGSLSDDNSKKQMSRFLQDACSCIEKKPVSSRDTVARLFGHVTVQGREGAEKLIGALHEVVPYWFLINGMAFQPGKMSETNAFRSLEVSGTAAEYSQAEALQQAFVASGADKHEITRLLWLASAYPKGLPKAFHPYLVRLLQKWVENPPAHAKAVIKNLQFIISYCYRLTFIGTPPTGLSSVMSSVMSITRWRDGVFGEFGTFYEKFATKDTDPERVSDPNVIQQSFRYRTGEKDHDVWVKKNNQTKKFLLFALQAEFWKARGNWKEMHVSNCWLGELEHICPTGKGRSEYPQVHDKYLNSVGNYTLLLKSVNAELKDKPWVEKRPRYATSDWARTRQIGEEWDNWSDEAIVKLEKEIFGVSERTRSTHLTEALPLLLS